MKETDSYNGTFYAEIGDFVRERFFDFKWTKGTRQEIDFVIGILELSAGQRILDIGCGVGRHSLELARRGYLAHGVDVSQGLLDVANEIATTSRLSATFDLQDARYLKFYEEFDAAICLCEGAFGHAGDDEGHYKILRCIYNALRPGTVLILSSINAFSGVRNADPETFNAYNATVCIKETIRNKQGEVREIDNFTTAFTYRELKLMLEHTGFSVEAGYGVEAGKFREKYLTIDDIEILVVARKAPSVTAGQSQPSIL